MSQLYDKAAVSERDAIVEDLGDWIDQYNIANLVVDALEEEWNCPPTLERAKDLWYRACEALSDFLEQISRRLPDPADEE
ncbi:MAG: hypothetical protein WB564_06135 [Dehalococcoidia bacterium]